MTDDSKDDDTGQPAGPDEPTRVRESAATPGEEPTLVREDDDGEAPTRVRADEASADEASASGAVDDVAPTADPEAPTRVRDAAAAVPAPPLGDDDATDRAPHLSTVMAAAARKRAAIDVGSVLRKRFELVEKLGEGGMGGVFKARDAFRDLEKHPFVAIKVLNDSFIEHPDAEKALKTEATKTQALNHRNIAGVFDFDHDDDTWFISMELLEGEPLDRLLKRHKDTGLPREQALSIIRDIAEGLGYAHAEHRLVHSDFKPGNIFITESGVAKVFDFGIARAATEEADGPGPVSAFDAQDLSDNSRDDTRFDVGNLRALTPAYASREMFENKEPAPQDDVYALGIVAYLCLTGRHPFERKKAFEAEGLGMKPARPEGLSQRQWKALQHALAFRREHRTPDAAAFVDEFFGETQRWPLYAAAAVVLVLLGGWWWLPSGPAVPVPPEWASLDATMDVSAALVDERLAEAAAPGFEFSAGWSESTWDAFSRWRRAARSVAVVDEFATVNGARTAQQTLHETHGVVTRVDVPAADSDAPIRLVAGPFPGDMAASDADLVDALAALAAAGVNAQRLDAPERIAALRERFVAVHLNAARALLADRRAPPQLATVAEGAGAVQFDAAEEAAFEARLARLRDVFQALGAVTTADRLGTDAELVQARDAVGVELGAWEDAMTTQRASVARANLGSAVQSGVMEVEAQRSRYLQQLGDVRAVFNNQCGDAAALGAALQDFDALQASRQDFTRLDAAGAPLRVDDKAAALDSLARCARSRIGGQPSRVRAALALVADHVQASYPQRALALRQVQPPDPCSAPGFVGNGRLQRCSDLLADGGSGPATVVVPALAGGAPYAIGRYEVSVAQYSVFCRATDCAEPAAGDAGLPLTGVSLGAAQAYTSWLTAQTGRTYRLPTRPEWQHAAAADGAAPDPNRNCTSSVRGVVRGEQLVSAGQGTANAWGLVNALGNAREWARGDAGWVAAGGRHSDPLGACTASAAAPHDGAADPYTGFRIVREIND